MATKKLTTVVVTDETCGLGHQPLAVVVFRHGDDGVLDWAWAGQMLPAGAVPVVAAAGRYRMLMATNAEDRNEALAMAEIAMAEIAMSEEGASDEH